MRKLLHKMLIMPCNIILKYNVMIKIYLIKIYATNSLLFFFAIIIVKIFLQIFDNLSREILM